MNLFKIFLLLLFIFTSLNAEYIRSIRLGSFPTEKAAQDSLVKVNEFVAEHENIIELMQERDFVFKERKSGRYYITLVEPFTDRKVLQEVLDTLRLAYPDIYVTRLKTLPKREETLDAGMVENFSKPSLEEVAATEPEIQEENLSDLSEVSRPEETLHEEVAALEEEISKEKSTEPLAVIPEEQEPEQKESTTPLYLFFLVAILLLVVGILLFLLLKLKKRNELYANQEMIYSEKLEKAMLDVYEKDKLLSHVSHELRTPMTAIMGLTHLILESKLSAVQKDYILKIEASSEHLLNLINDILDVSKIQAGELKLEKSEFNINSILEYVLSVNAMHAKRNSVSFFMNVDLDVPSKVIGDSLRLSQVLINLIGNAVKFTNNGEVTLHVRKLSTIGENLKLEFEVSDTGIGMTQEQVERIFNSYYQANDSTTREFGGTGLGLSISKDLVELMGGEIHVTSKKDVGTSFVFTVVLKLKDPENKRYYRLPSATMLNKKILIVDSSNKNVISLIRSLGYFNYQTHSIPSFEESVLEEELIFDILIVNQYSLTAEAIKKIRSMQEKMKTKLVVINEIYSAINSELIEDLHVDAYLQVPATQQNVLNMIIDLYVTKNLDKRSRKTSMKDKLKAFKGKKILVAEDNDVNQKVILGLLTQTGIELTFVDNGHEAVDLIRKGVHFDLVLMDINMPNLNGYEATKEIRKSEKYNSLPILALTGDVTEEAVTKALAYGMQGHISKPIVIDIFYKKIIDIFTTKKKSFVETTKEKNPHISASDGYEELSLSVGLTRCEGDSDFYKSILQDFKSMYGDSVETLTQLCRESKFKEARRMAMDIKDIALNIGAYNLGESAASMEYEFEKGERSNWRELITYYEGVLQTLFRDIDKYINS